MSARFHSSPKKTGLFTAANASKTTDLHPDRAVGADLVTVVLDLADGMIGRVKCMM